MNATQPIIDVFTGPDKEVPSPILDPFRAECIEEVVLRIHRGCWHDNRDTIFFDAHIEFKNGGTEGKHIIRAPSWLNLLQQITAVVESLQRPSK